MLSRKPPTFTDLQAPPGVDNCYSPSTPSSHHNGARYQGPCLGTGVAICPAVFLSYFSLWICYEIKLTNTKIKMSNSSRMSREIYWTGGASNTDEFSEKFQTAFDPQSPPQRLTEVLLRKVPLTCGHYPHLLLPTSTDTGVVRMMIMRVLSRKPCQSCQ